MQIWQPVLTFVLLTLPSPNMFANSRSTNTLQRGSIIFLDGMAASGKSSLAKELKKRSPSFILLSSDDLAVRRRESPLHHTDYVQAALDTVDQAEELANSGQVVIVDSWLTKKAWELKSSERFDTRIYGLWCPLSCLKARYDKREGSKGAWRRSALERDYKERYAHKIDREILESQGSWQMDRFKIDYDMFFNTEMISTTTIAKHIIDDIRRNLAQ